MVIRAGKMPYYLAKYAALFVSGGLAVVTPLLFNFLLTAMFIPAVRPDPSYLTAYGIGPASFLSMLFYAHPFLYVFAYLLIDFLFCPYGLYPCQKSYCRCAAALFSPSGSSLSLLFAAVHRSYGHLPPVFPDGIFKSGPDLL